VSYGGAKERKNRQLSNLELTVHKSKPSMFSKTPQVVIKSIRTHSDLPSLLPPNLTVQSSAAHQTPQIPNRFSPSILTIFSWRIPSLLPLSLRRSLPAMGLVGVRSRGCGRQEEILATRWGFL